MNFAHRLLLVSVFLPQLCTGIDIALQAVRLQAFSTLHWKCTGYFLKSLHSYSIKHYSQCIFEIKISIFQYQLCTYALIFVVSVH